MVSANLSLGISIEASPASISFVSPNASFPIPDFTELPHIISDEIVSQILRALFARINQQNGVFLDEIENELYIQGQSLT